MLYLVGYLYNWQMGFNSVFKGLTLYPYGKYQYENCHCFESSNKSSMQKESARIQQERKHRLPLVMRTGQGGERDCTAYVAGL